MKFRSIALLMIAEVAALSLWFVSAAILPEMLREAAMSPVRQAMLSSGVQIGFVVGALASSILGLADRYDPRRVFAVCAVTAGLCNAILLIAEPGGASAIFARFATGALLAGVYPVGMKIAVGWGEKDRGTLVGLLIGALTLGSALPYLISTTGGADWRFTVTIASIAAISGGLLALLVQLGPHYAKAARFQISAISLAWHDRRIRYAYGGYLGHMWELYVMWAWIAAACAVSFSATMTAESAVAAATMLAFVSIATGGVFSIIAGLFADRIGKAEVAGIAMAVSGLAGLATALTFGGPVWITVIVVLVWGASVIPDSAQFSAMVADAAPQEAAGSLMTFQTALGFALTFFTVQIAPWLAAQTGWALVIALTALGPAFGIFCMVRHRRIAD
ncbi:nitrate/nitrite transporter [Pseudahrensia aquimaris]|uniref:Nitrate/nitrite transporter n=1 Tax=Pseudahrensia aquimaris TaxID=744461 RepID=A0ABW3FHY6_9HYPH